MPSLSTAPALAALLALVAPLPPSAPEPPVRLTGAALTEGGAYTRLAELTDLIGPRLSGSPGAAAAVEWAAARLRADGLSVRLEPVRVPRWVRGEEKAWVVSPGRPGRALAATALGGSPPTPAAGLQAELLEVSSLEELAALGEQVRGRVVLFQHQMGTGMTGYGAVSALRNVGPAAAARAGAAAALVRSLATASLRSPHTGATDFPAGGPQIPAAALATEDAELLHRLAARGPVRVGLLLSCRMADPPEVDSANVVAEVRGRERPEEVVLLGAHLDSWDLGTGAIDDGAGVAVVMEALRLAAAQPVAPRRTLRGVLFMNEENGLRGGLSYAERHGGEAARHVAALEADAGAGRPIGFEVDAGPNGLGLVSRLARPLGTLGAQRVRSGGGGADISPLRYLRVPVVTVEQDTTRYFDLHHSAADTLDKVDPRELASLSAAVAVMAWGLADAPETLERPPAPAEPPWWLPLPAPSRQAGERR